MIFTRFQGQPASLEHILNRGDLNGLNRILMSDKAIVNYFRTWLCFMAIWLLNRTVTTNILNVIVLRI